MILLSYASMLLNAGAVMTSFVLVDRLCELPYLYAREGNMRYPKNGVVIGRQLYLLEKCGAGKRWKLALWHCE